MQKDRAEALETLVQAMHRLTRDAALATGDNTPASARQILALLNHSGEHRVGEIAAQLRMSQPGVTQALRALLEAGLIERKADTFDARASVIAITEAGRASASQWRSAVADALSPLTAGLSDADWEHIAAAAAILGSLAETR